MGPDRPVADRLRLADLIGALSLVADLGFGLPAEHAMRSCLIATDVARRMGMREDEVRDAYYTALLMHVGCVALSHESAAAIGDEFAVGRASSVANMADPADVAASALPELTRGMSAPVRRRVESWAAVHGRHYVLPDDIKALVAPAWQHRLLLDAEAEFAGTTADVVLSRVLETVAAPQARTAA